MLHQLKLTVFRNKKTPEYRLVYGHHCITVEINTNIFYSLLLKRPQEFHQKMKNEILQNTFLKLCITVTIKQ